MNTTRILEALGNQNKRTVDGLKGLRRELDERRLHTASVFDSFYSSMRQFEENIMADYVAVERRINEELEVLTGNSASAAPTAEEAAPATMRDALGGAAKIARLVKPTGENGG